MNIENMIDIAMEKYMSVVLDCAGIDRVLTDYAGLLQELVNAGLFYRYVYKNGRMWAFVKGIQYRCDIDFSDKKATLTIRNLPAGQTAKQDITHCFSAAV